MKKARLNTQIQKLQDNIQLNASGVLPLTLVSDLLIKVKKQGAKEKESEIQQRAKEFINQAFDFYSRNSADVKSISAFIDFLEKQVSDKALEIVYGLSDRGLLQINQLCDEATKVAISSTDKYLKEKEAIKDKVDEIENYLSIDINEDALHKLYTQIRKLEQQIIDIETVLASLEQKRRSANGDLIKATSEFNKKVSILLESMEMDDDNKRVVKYSEMALRVLDTFSVKIQQRKTGVLGDTITECYKKLANKKNLIDKIKMDPVSLDLQYIGREGNLVEKNALSAGEKQLMVIAILWALAICSKKKLPVIIDTPLSRLDSNHRKALIKTYFPYASDQTIILSTDSEIDQKYYQLMKDAIGDEFTLQYDDESKSTTIKKGYFIGD